MAPLLCTFHNYPNIHWTWSPMSNVTLTNQWKKIMLKVEIFSHWYSMYMQVLRYAMVVRNHLWMYSELCEGKSNLRYWTFKCNCIHFESYFSQVFILTVPIRRFTDHVTWSWEITKKARKYSYNDMQILWFLLTACNKILYHR
jgi:hypothetical protein